MRISDRSSDVCSSELGRCRQDDPCRQPRGGARACGPRPLAGGRRSRGPPSPLPSCAPIDLGKLALPPATGRAWCRERGWQYVSISVVAVSLKKKSLHLLACCVSVIFSNIPREP